MKDFLITAAGNEKKAWEIIRETNIINIWESEGMEINLVGSLANGLLMKHRDIDFHIYSPSLHIHQSFSAISRLAENPAIKHIEYTNLIDTEEKCIEWHAWYSDVDNESWQIDMIHILKGSFFDGHAEKLAKRISEVITPETKEAILRIKNDTPESEKIAGFEYYKAVIKDGIRDYSGFTKWREKNPVTGIDLWIP